MSVTQVLTPTGRGGRRHLRVDARALVSSRLAQVAIVAGLTLALWPSMRSDGGLQVLRLLVPVYFWLLCARWLMPAALLLLFLSADGLGLFGTSSTGGLPYLQLLPTLRLTIRDALLVATLPIAVAHLRRRRELPIFSVSLLGVAAAISFAFLLGFVSDGDAHTPLNMLRPLFGYALYLTIVAAIDTRRKLQVFVWALLGVAVCAVGVELLELLTGQQQLPGASPTDEQRVVQVGAQLAVYALNPAPLQMFLGLFLALGGILDRGKLRYVAPATVYLIGFIVGLTRSWYVFIGAGVLVMLLVMALLAPHQRARASARPLVALLSLGAILAVTLARVSQGEGNLSLAGLWAQRAATLFSVQNDPSYQVRVATLSAQWQHVLAKPLFGYGLSNDGYEFVANLGRQDTGLVNSLLLFGFIGIIPFVVLILHGFRHSIAAYRRLSDSDERGYVLGLAGVWVGLTVGYIFDWDFMTSINGPWLPVLALGILDRASRLTK